MSEYWVSHKKYFCKYCDIYIADDAPSRRQHETGLRHKGNVERFVRGLYKAGEKRKRDLDEEKREMARIEQAANAAFQQDLGEGRVNPGSSSSAGPSSSTAVAGPKKVAASKPSNPYANYSTAESLGFTDPDAARAEAEAERRRTQGVAGEWQVVSVVDQGDGREDDHEEGREGAGGQAEGTARTGEKRLAEGLVDEEDAREWKLRRKAVSVGLGDLYDPGAMPIKLKQSKEEKQLDSSRPLNGGEVPKWSARGWNKPGTSSLTEEAKEGQEAEQEEGWVKAEEGDVLEQLVDEALTDDTPVYVKAEEVKLEPTLSAAPPAPAGGSIFKKRKVPAGGGSRGGRRI